MKTYVPVTIVFNDMLECGEEAGVMIFYWQL